MRKAESSVVIDAPPQRVYELLSDPSHIPDWLVSMTSTSDVKGEGVGSTFNWTYRMAGVELSGTCKVTEAEPPTKLVMVASGGIESTWVDHLAPVGDGTRVTVDVEYEIPVPVLGRLAEELVHGRNQRELDASLQNLKDLVEHGKLERAA